MPCGLKGVLDDSTCFISVCSNDHNVTQPLLHVKPELFLVQLALTLRWQLEGHLACENLLQLSWEVVLLVTDQSSEDVQKRLCVITQHTTSIVLRQGLPR